MDFEKLVDPIIQFLNFYIGFWRGDQTIYDEFIGNKEINANALLLCLIGIGIQLAFRYATIGSVPTDPNARKAAKPSLDTNSVLFRAIVGLTSPLLFELSLWLLGTRDKISAPAEAVFNAFFVVYALLGPISGAQTRLATICAELSKVKGKTASIASAFNICIAALCVWAYWHCFKAIAAILQVPWNTVYPAILLSMFLLFLFLSPGMAALYQWNKFIATSDRKSEN